MTCPARTAVTTAPQLAGVVRWWPGADQPGIVVIPRDLVAELATAWASMPPADAPWLDERKAVGERAERYSMQWETDRLPDPTKLRWVSRESDELGWDIEDRNDQPFRAIEVKGSRGNDPAFFVSENELARAREFGERYEIQFWGGINLASNPAEEFARLLDSGFPVVVKDLAAALERGDWIAVPVKWRVTPAPPTPPLRAAATTLDAALSAPSG